MKQAPHVAKITIDYEDGSSDHFCCRMPPSEAPFQYGWTRKFPKTTAPQGAFTVEEVAQLLYKTALCKSMCVYYVIDPSIIKPMKTYVKIVECIGKKQGRRALLPHGEF